jgi:predicted GNAT family acetyltransferase
MTNLLHPAHTSPLLTSVADIVVDAPDDVLPLAGGITSRPTPVVPVDTHEQERAAFNKGLSTENLRALSTRQLRVMVNQAYKLMDTAYPPYGVLDRYDLLVDELEHRAQQAADRATTHRAREAFRNNPLYCRFELFIDGTLAVYLKYEMNGGQLLLIDGVEQPEFRDQGIDATLMRQVVLNAHRRRLSLIPQCPMAFSFLADHPEYQALTARPTR